MGPSVYDPASPMTPLNSIQDLLYRYKYAAMFSILVLCGLGLPLPEEVTLLASGLAVGWRQADWFLASAACVSGILVGDSVVFALGRYWGKPFLASRPMRFLLPPRRQVKVQKLFAKHGVKTVFFARFFAGVRLGVYAYAGQHGMAWTRFILLDLVGALISAPASIWIGKFAAEKLADPDEARAFAEHVLKQGQVWIYIGIGLLIALGVLHWLWGRWASRRKPSPEAPPGEGRESESPRVPCEFEEYSQDCR